MVADVSRQFRDVAGFFAECDAMAARVGGRSLTAAFLLPEGAGTEELARAREQLRRLDNAMLSVLIADMALYRLLRRVPGPGACQSRPPMGALPPLSAAGAPETPPPS